MIYPLNNNYDLEFDRGSHRRAVLGRGHSDRPCVQQELAGALARRNDVADRARASA